MKLRTTIYSVFAVLAFIACDDDLSPVGMGIQPEDNKITVRTDTISFTSSTQIVDSVFVKAANGWLGSFDDVTYGNIKYGYLCNFYSSPDSVFRTVINDKIDSVVLRLQYYNFVGDSLAPMEATVYGIGQGKTLNKHFYSNIDPWQYTNKDSVWAKKAYTARNLNVSDSIYSLTSRYRNLKFDLPNHVGQRIYDTWKDVEQRDVFKDLDKFFDFFPGVYIESSYGSGNILNVEYTTLEVYYRTYIESVQTGRVDSAVTRYALFNSSGEVTQLNQFKSRDGENSLTADTEHTYLKTPAGAITQLEISLQDIVNKIGNDRVFNNVGLSLDVEEQKQEKYTLPIPPQVLLINPDSVIPFFEEARIANSSYSYYATLPTSATAKLRYDFGNISNLIQNSIKHLNDQEIPLEEWPLLKLWVIPIATPSFDGYNISITTNYFEPSGAKIKTGDDLKLHIITSKVNK